MTAIETALTKNNMQIVFQEEQHFPMEAAMNYLSLGKRIYNCCRWINYRFLVVFWLRCIFHPHEVRHLHDFLQANRLRQRIFAVNPQFFGQLTRCFFFRGGHLAGTACLDRDDHGGNGGLLFKGIFGAPLFR